MSEDLKAKAHADLAKAEIEVARQKAILKSMDNPTTEVACKLHEIFCSRWCDLGDWGAGHYAPGQDCREAGYMAVYGRYHRAATEVLQFYQEDLHEALKAVEAIARALRNEEDRKQRERW